MLQKSQQGLQGTGLMFFFFEAARRSQQQQCDIESAFGAGVAKAAGPESHNVPGEAAGEDSLRVIIPSGI